MVEVRYCPACLEAVVLDASGACPLCRVVKARHLLLYRPAARALPLENRRRWVAGLIGFPTLQNGWIDLSAPLGQQVCRDAESFESACHGMVSKTVNGLLADLLRISWSLRSRGQCCLFCGHGPLQPHSSDPGACFGQHDALLRRMGLRRRSDALT